MWKVNEYALEYNNTRGNSLHASLASSSKTRPAASSPPHFTTITTYTGLHLKNCRENGSPQEVEKGVQENVYSIMKISVQL